jgi:hypothetical protein
MRIVIYTLQRKIKMKINRRQLRRLIESVINEDVMDYFTSNASIVDGQPYPYLKFFEDNNYDFAWDEVTYYDGSKMQQLQTGIKEKPATRNSSGVAVYIKCRGTSEAETIAKVLNEQFPIKDDTMRSEGFEKAVVQGEYVLIYQDRIYGG